MVPGMVNMGRFGRRVVPVTPIYTFRRASTFCSSESLQPEDLTSPYEIATPTPAPKKA